MTEALQTSTIEQVAKPVTDSSLARIVVVLLEASRCPIPPQFLWDLRGMRQFIRLWPELPPGAPQELKAILGLVDPDARVTARTSVGPNWPVDMPHGKTVIGVAPRRKTLHFSIIWSRRDLARHTGKLGLWLADLSCWFTPLRFDNVSIDCGFPGAIAAGSMNPRAEESTNQHSSDFSCSPYFRRASDSASTVLSVEGDSRLRPAGIVVVTHESFNRFLSNTEPFIPVWRTNTHSEGKPGQDEWTALRSTSNLEVVTKGVRKRLYGVIDGVLLEATPANREGVFVFKLPNVVPAGGAVKLECRAENEHAVDVFPNPVVFRVVPYRQHVDSERIHSSMPSMSQSVDAGSFETLLAGCAGITSIRQPQRLQATFCDARLTDVRTTDIERTLLRRFLRIQSAKFLTFCRWNPPSQPQRVVHIKIATTPNSVVSNNQIKHSVIKELSHRLPTGTSLQIEVESHEQ